MTETQNEDAAGGGFSLEYGDADARRFVSSQEDLAIALGCISRRTIARLLKMPGNPGKTANGSYPLEAWREFYEEICEAREREEDLALTAGDGGSVKAGLAAKRLEREAIRVERERLELAKARGELVALEEVKAEWRALYERILSRVKRVFVESATTPEEFDEAQKRFLRLMETIHAEEKNAR